MTIEQTDAVPPGATGQSPDQERHLATFVQTDPAAVKHDRGVGAATAKEAAVEARSTATGERNAPEGEGALVLEEEVAFLWEEQAEPREVHLLLVGFDLREVCVDGQLGNETLGDGILRVETRLSSEIVQDGGVAVGCRDAGVAYGLRSRLRPPRGTWIPTNDAAN